MDKKPWWKDAKYPELGKGIVGGSWIAQALVQQSVEGAGCFKYSETSGSLTCTSKELLDAVEGLGGRVVKDSVAGPLRFRDPEYLAIWDDGYLEVRLTAGEADVEFYYGSNSHKRFSQIEGLVGGVLKKRVIAGRVYTVVVSSDGPYLRKVGVAGTPFIADNYTPDVVEAFNHIVADIQSFDPCGRLSMFDGPPGSGKTFLTRGLLDAAKDAIFVMIPPSMVPELSGPSLINALIDNKENRSGSATTVLVVEDADACLVARGPDNMGAISSLLNMADGMMGSMLNLRILCTTNAGHLKNEDDLDVALLRPGRLCRRVRVGALPPEQAEAVYTRLTGKQKPFDQPMSVAEVYRIARDAGWTPTAPKKSMGFASGGLRRGGF